jgi:6-pyruvoyl-tetrahydropterin synthase related domain
MTDVPEVPNEPTSSPVELVESIEQSGPLLSVEPEHSESEMAEASVEESPAPPTPVPSGGRRNRNSGRNADAKHKKQVAQEAGQKIFSWTVLLCGTALIMVLMRFDWILSNSTPTGGDNAVHVWTGDYLKRVLIPQGRLFGWSNDSYAGLPVLSSYFPLPMWTIVALSYVIPYGVAFKLISAIGVFLLPLSTYRLGRKAELPWPEPLLLGAGVFPFLLARHFKILGGNIMSTMAGEFSFSISLCLTVLYMGSLIVLLRTNRGRTRTTLLLAGIGLCHIVPAILAIGFTFASTLCELRRASWKRQIGEVFRVGLTALALAAFWVIPFGLNIPYTNSMDYERNTRWLKTLIPILPNSSTLHTPADGVALASVFFVCALIGIVVGLRRRDRFVATMTLTAIIAGVQFGLAPRGAMWNNRLLPAWFFCVYVLGAVGLFYVLRLLKALGTRLTQRNKALFASSGSVTNEVSAPAGIGWPVLLAAGIVFGTLGPAMLPGKVGLPFAWARGNYKGTEGRKAYPEYRNLISVLKTLPCGRLFSEPGVKRYQEYGSSMAMAALPYWTKGCIQTIDGLYFEASQTTPFSYLTAKWMSPNAAGAQRRLPYQPFNMATGVERLRGLGVRYVLLSTPKAKDDARKISALRFIETTGPYSIFEISDNAVVVPLEVEPVVVTTKSGGRVNSFINVGLAQWVRPNEFPPFVADTGPKNWKRSVLNEKVVAPNPVVASTSATAKPVKPVKPVKVPEPRRGDGLSMSTSMSAEPTSVVPAVVSNVKIGDQGLSFRVDEPGKPVLVRVSYFPNWKVSGAKGPYRVGPNFMVVVPTQNDVSLKFRYTAIEFGSFGVTVAGMASLILGAIQSRRARKRRIRVSDSSSISGSLELGAIAPAPLGSEAPQITGVLPPLEGSTTKPQDLSPSEQSDPQ